MDNSQETYKGTMSQLRNYLWGLELEYPVVNLSGNATDAPLPKQLVHLLIFDFQADKYDSINNPIQFIDASET